MKTAFAAIGVLLALVQAADAAVLGQRMVASTNQKAILRAEKTTTSQFNVLVKEFYLPYGGTVHLSWRFKTDGTNFAIVNVLLNRYNATPCGPTTNSGTFVTESCDVVHVPAGSHVQIYMRSQNGASTVYLRDLRVSFDLVDVTRPVVPTVD
jgi:hypothetical protein